MEFNENIEADFTKSIVNPLRMYGGANGNKIGIIYKDEHYMLKFPPKPARSLIMSYTNSCISEHVACRIFKALGIDTQTTILGHYNGKITVACKDFEVSGFTLKDFAQLKNTIIDSEQNGYGTELNDILLTIREQQIVPPAELLNFFWRMFICDALLGNFDRHNGNWGFLVNQGTGEVKIAPVFDCGSCLYPQIDEVKMDYIMSNTVEIDERIFKYPTSALQQNGKKINYFQFLMTTGDAGCIDALKDVSMRIDMRDMQSIIDDTPFISGTYKRFLFAIISERKGKIIDSALARL